jgi:hypothetical protein
MHQINAGRCKKAFLKLLPNILLIDGKHPKRATAHTDALFNAGA